MQASQASPMVRPFVPRCLSQARGAEGMEGPAVATAPKGRGGAKAPPFHRSSNRLASPLHMNYLTSLLQVTLGFEQRIFWN